MTLERKLNQIDRSEALRYLGCWETTPPAELEAAAERAVGQLFRIARPKAVWRRFRLEGMSLAGTSYELEGEDIRRHLAGCGEVILMAATMGHEVEQLLLRSQIRDLSQALVLDCCASAAIESVCDDLEAELREMVEGEGNFLTGRYSPGYGDYPLSHQSALCTLLDTQRQTGLTLTASGLMVPRKSVTAVLGISAAPRKQTKRSCESCNLRDTCQLRKGGRSCEN